MIVFDQPIDLNPRIDIQRVLGDVEDRRITVVFSKSPEL